MFGQFCQQLRRALAMLCPATAVLIYQRGGDQAAKSLFCLDKLPEKLRKGFQKQQGGFAQGGVLSVQLDEYLHLLRVSRKAAAVALQQVAGQCQIAGVDGALE